MAQEEVPGLRERLRIAREEVLGKTQESLAKEMGVPPRSIQNWEGGKSAPKAWALYQYTKIGVSADWLLTGEDRETTGLQEEERELLRRWRQLEDHERRYLLGLMDGMLFNRHKEVLPARASPSGS